MDFGDAIRALKAGQRVARQGWNGKEMWLILAASSIAAVREHGSDKLNRLVLLPHIVMKTAQAQYVPWLASQTDMLADDWVNLDAAEQGAAPAAKRYALEDIDVNSLKWATLPHHEDPFQDKVSYVVSMRDGKQVRGTIRLPDDGTAWPTNRVAAACALDAIRVANGEAP